MASSFGVDRVRSVAAFREKLKRRKTIAAAAPARECPPDDRRPVSKLELLNSCGPACVPRPSQTIHDLTKYLLVGAARQLRPLASSSYSEIVHELLAPLVAWSLPALHLAPATRVAPVKTSTDKEFHMITSLGTVSEMTKGWEQGSLLDTNEKIAMGAFVRYLVTL
jgi:hypothetical protein